LKYSDFLGQLERYSLTININAHNYSEKLQQLQEKLPKDEGRFKHLALLNQKMV